MSGGTEQIHESTPDRTAGLQAKMLTASFPSMNEYYAMAWAVVGDGETRLVPPPWESESKGREIGGHNVYYKEYLSFSLNKF
jgi:hypothetical protein